MEFASEMVIKATLLGLRIAEVPTTLSKDGRTRPPHLRPWRDGWRHLRFMLLYSPRWLFLYPGLLLMVLGAVVGIPLLAGPIRLTSHVAFDVHTLLFAFAAIVLGFQCVAFAVCARVYALNEGLLPHEPLLERALKHFTLETGLIAGALLMVFGFGGAVAAFVGWSRTGFGPLDSRVTLRTGHSRGVSDVPRRTDRADQFSSQLSRTPPPMINRCAGPPTRGRPGRQR